MKGVIESRPRLWYNMLNQMTARQWQGGLTVSGRTQPGAANVLVNGRAAQIDAGGEYVVQELDVTTPLLSNQGIGDGRTRDLVTAVNTNMQNQSILWETIRMAPQQVEMSYDADSPARAWNESCWWSGSSHIGKESRSKCGNEGDWNMANNAGCKGSR